MEIFDMKTKFTTTFSSIVKPIVSEEKDKYLALASLLDLEKFVPNVDAEENYDLLPVAFNAFVANRVNKNGDVVDTETALSFYKNFLNKPINIEHNRKNVIGTILEAGFSSFGDDKPLTEEDIKNTTEPFNVTLGGVIWKITNQELAAKIEDSADPTGDNYMSISASWELGFNDYNIILLEAEEKNIGSGEEISEEESVKSFEGFLRGMGGEGKTPEGKNVYRKVIGKVLPLGIGLTENPAADVSGVLSLNKEFTQTKSSENEKDEKNISQNTNSTVIKKRQVKAMKINCLNDITDESMQDLTASVIHDFIQDSLKDASEKFAAEKQEKEDALVEANEKHEALTKEHDTLKAEIEALQEKLNSLEQEKIEKENFDKFNARMASFDERYDLTEEDRKVLASRLENISDEDFENFNSDMSILLSSKIKAEEKEENTETTPEETVASVENIVDEAVENGKVDEQSVPVSSPTEEPTIQEKYSKAFTVENFDIKL